MYPGQLQQIKEKKREKKVVRMCPATSNSYRTPQNGHELTIFWSAKKRRKATFFFFFFFTLHPLSPVIFATATMVAFVLLRNYRFNFHSYTQREATPTQKSARK